MKAGEIVRFSRWPIYTHTHIYLEKY